MEKKKCCKYCKGAEINQQGFTFLIDKDKELEVFHHRSSLITYLEIKYCPFCGAKL